MINEHDYLYKKKITEKNLNKRFYLPIFLCFGQNEIDLYKKYKISVGRFKIVGNLRLENFLLNIKKKPIRPLNKTYDICLLSDVGAWINELEKDRQFVVRIEKSLALLTKYCIQFSLKHNLRMVHALKRLKPNKSNAPVFGSGNISSFDKEINLYKKYLTKKEFEYIKKNFYYRKANKFGMDRFATYKLMQKSEVVIGSVSTLLKENLVMGGKTLICNMSQLNMYNFPINDLCSLKYCSFPKFEKRLISILKMPKKRYFNKLGKKRFYPIYYNKNINTSELVKREINSLLK